MKKVLAFVLCFVMFISIGSSEGYTWGETMDTPNINWNEFYTNEETNTHIFSDDVDPEETQAQAETPESDQPDLESEEDMAFLDNEGLSYYDGKIQGQFGSVNQDIGNRVPKYYYKNRCPNAFTNGYLKPDGTIAIYGDWITTDFIFVGDSENIISSWTEISTGNRIVANMQFLTKYGEGKNVIAQETAHNGAYTVEANVKYIRFCIHSDVYDEIQTEIGTAATEYEEYMDGYIVKNAPYTRHETVRPAVEAATYVEYVSNKNRYTGVGDVDGYLNSDGTIHAGADWKTTGKIDVKGASHIYSSQKSTTGRAGLALWFLCVYDDDGVFIEQIGNVTSLPYAIPDGVGYIRFCYHPSSVTEIQVEAGASMTSYVPHEIQIKFTKSPYNDAKAYKWDGLKWACVGDSLTEVNIRTTKHYHDYVAESTGISVVNMGVSGTGYARGLGENSFYDRIDGVPTDADVVTIFGSGNDAGAGLDLGEATDTGFDTLAGCINETIDLLFDTYPLANVGIVSPTPWSGGNDPLHPSSWMAQYSELLKEICELRGIPFLDLFHCSGLRPWEESYRELCYSKDDGNGVHPDETGHALIAPRFEAFLDSLLLH